MKALNNAALAPHAERTAPALSALVMRQPAVRNRALGLVCSAFADSVWLVKSEEIAAQTNPELDQELVQAVHEWADRLLQVGVTILFAAAALIYGKRKVYDRLINRFITTFRYDGLDLLQVRDADGSPALKPERVPEVIRKRLERLGCDLDVALGLRAPEPHE